MDLTSILLRTGRAGSNAHQRVSFLSFFFFPSLSFVWRLLGKLGFFVETRGEENGENEESNWSREKMKMTCFVFVPAKINLKFKLKFIYSIQIFEREVSRIGFRNF